MTTRHATAAAALSAVLPFVEKGPDPVSVFVSNQYDEMTSERYYTVRVHLYGEERFIAWRDLLGVAASDVSTETWSSGSVQTSAETDGVIAFWLDTSNDSDEVEDEPKKAVAE